MHLVKPSSNQARLTVRTDDGEKFNCRTMKVRPKKSAESLDDTKFLNTGYGGGNPTVPIGF